MHVCMLCMYDLDRVDNLIYSDSKSNNLLQNLTEL